MEAPRPRYRARNGERLIMLSHPLELLAIAIGSIITACVFGALFAFMAATVAGIVQF